MASTTVAQAFGLTDPQVISTPHFYPMQVFMDLDWLRPAAFFGSLLYALVGVVVFWLCFVLIDKITPHDLWREIIEKQNRALAMVVAAMCLGISIIVAAAIHSGS